MTLTKEWLLRAIAELEEERDATPGAVNEDAVMALAAMKLALASLEAEAVAIVEPSDYVTAAQLVGEEPRSKAVRPLFEGALSFGQKLYAVPRLDNPFCPKCGGTGLADSGGTHPWGEPIYIECDCRSLPPAPVSVPEWTNEQCLEFLSIAFRHAEIKGDLELDDIRLGVKMVNGSRAAMLQGAEPVTTDYKLRDAVEIIRNSGIEIDAEKILAERDALNSPVIPDGWKLVPVEPTEEMITSGIAAHFERSQTQIHDRPAPGPMECAYVAMLAAAPQQEA
ncbi:hypothetical protein QL503_002031 [Salmonella enterica]|nr:hypothetical protein [Salmonella enterica]